MFLSDCEMKPIPRNARYEELRDVSGIEGGKLLAIVLRDLLAGKVWTHSAQTNN